MWSSEAKLGALAALLGSLGLAGCFTPLYQGGADSPVAHALQEIEVDPISDRIGHYLGDSLIFALNGTGSKIAPKFRLKITPAERVETPVVNTVTGQASSATVLADADYVLTTIPDNRVLTRGTAFTSAAYNRSLQQFANVTAARDAEVRDADSLADQIRIRLAAYFSAHPDLH